MEKYVIGVDLGGTNIVTGMVDRSGKVVERCKRETQADRGKDVVIKNIEESIRKVISDVKIKKEKISGIGIGSPGSIDHDNGIVHTPPNLPGWKHVPLKRIIESNLKFPTFVANDVNAVALGEATFGAGVGFANSLCITLGTGVGGGIILGGKLYVGSHQFAGEIGHMVVEKDGLPCKCGGIGCLERYVGRDYIISYAVEAIKNGKYTKIKELVNNDLSKITPKVITDAAKLNDKLALEIWDKVGRYIGVILGGVLNFLDPGVIIIGGGISLAGKFVFEPIRDEVKKRAFPMLAKIVKIVPAKLGDNAGCIGASQLIYQKKVESKDLTPLC